MTNQQLAYLISKEINENGCGFETALAKVSETEKISLTEARSRYYRYLDSLDDDGYNAEIYSENN